MHDINVPFVLMCVCKFSLLYLYSSMCCILNLTSFTNVLAIILRSGYWSGNRTFIPVAIGPAIGHVVKHQSDSCYIYAFYNAFCAISSVQSDSGIFSPVG